MDSRRIIFVHIPKTGGSTLQGIINRQYRKSVLKNVQNDGVASELSNLPKEELEKIKVLKGHMAFGHHKEFPDPENATYITMLRHPVKRIISIYYFIFKLEQHYLYDKMTKEKTTLKEYVESGMVANAENFQVRLLSNNLDAPHGGCTREMLEQAKKNLDEWFSVVGVNDLYDETILFMKDEFGWRFPYYSRLNVTGHGVSPKDLDQETLDVILKYNALDLELYEYARANLIRRIEEEGASFQKRLKRYKRGNRYFDKLARIKRFFFK